MNAKVLGVLTGISGAVLIVTGFYVTIQWTFALGAWPLIVGVFLLVRLTPAFLEGK